MSGSTVLAALGLVAGAAAGAPLAAQVTVLSPLGFGTILSGSPASVAPTDANAASWRIHGTLGINATITLTLPAQLNRSGGGATMAVSFCSTCAIYRVNNSNPSGGTTFNPQTGANLPVVALSDIYVWLGGSVSPPLSQTPGSYTGTVVVTVANLL